MTLYTTALWFYSVMASLVFGAGMYESFVVHPAWSREPPQSLVGFGGSPVSRMNLPAFWMPVTPLYALSGLGALAVALWAGSRDVPLVLSAVCAVSALAWTLAYFRPTIHRLLQDGGGNTPADTSSPRPGGGFGSIGSAWRSSQSPGGELSLRLQHVCETRAA